MSNETYHPRGRLVDGYHVREHPLYYVWADMKARCADTENDNYGARGISYCARWRHFENFAVDMGSKPFPEATLERKNNDIGYQPDNCIWADRKQQSRNRRVFKNNSSGYKGVVQKPNGTFNARYDDDNVRYNLGNFETAEEAKQFRLLFIYRYIFGFPSAFSMIERRARLDSTVGIRGISAHSDGGFVVRTTVNKQRIYVGYSPTLSGAIELQRAYDER